MFYTKSAIFRAAVIFATLISMVALHAIARGDWTAAGAPRATPPAANVPAGSEPAQTRFEQLYGAPPLALP